MVRRVVVFLALFVVNVSAFAGNDSVDQFRQCSDCSVQQLDSFFNDSDRPYESFKLVHGAGTKGGVVLLHGLTDSPYYMKDIAAMYFQNGYDVYVPLLKGHGNSYAVMEQVQNTEWNSAVENIVKEVSNKYSDKIMLGGFSNGALLATVNVFSESSLNKISSLLLLSPSFNLPFKDRMKLKAALGFDALVRMTKWSILKSALAKLKVMKVDSGMAVGTTGQVRYNDMPLNAVLQLGRNSSLLDKRSRHKTLDIPLVMVLSSADSRISKDIAVDKFQKLFSGQKHLIWLQSPEDTNNDVAKPPKNLPAQNLTVIPVHSLIKHVITVNKVGLASPNERNPVYMEMERRISELVFQPAHSSKYLCLSFY